MCCSSSMLELETSVSQKGGTRIRTEGHSYTKRWSAIDSGSRKCCRASERDGLGEDELRSHREGSARTRVELIRRPAVAHGISPYLSHPMQIRNTPERCEKWIPNAVTRHRLPRSPGTKLHSGDKYSESAIYLEKEYAKKYK